MPPEWLTVIAWIWLGIAFISSGVILFDVFVAGHRQQMGVMEAVYRSPRCTSGLSRSSCTGGGGDTRRA
jgi:hypothetical protein